MPSSKPKSLAVLMGDLVGSERARSVKAIHRAFNKTIDAANKRHAEIIESPLTITLGDEFQGLLRTLQNAWSVASELRLGLLAANVSCRFVIGTTRLETPVNIKEAWNMMGSGLAAAREKLNDKRTGNAYRFSLPGEPILESLLDAVGDSLTEVEIGWTATQLEYIEAAWGVQDEAKTAQSLGVAPRSLYKVLRAARAEFHRRQSAIIGRALEGLDERFGLR
jgi:hypothetical protein